jgi:hypothetical protein
MMNNKLGRESLDDVAAAAVSAANNGTPHMQEKLKTQP